MKLFSKYFWRNLRNRISYLFFPRQRWLTKSIPSWWQDKPELLITIFDAVIIDFVEGEKCFENTDWSYNRQPAEKPVKDAYHWFKWGRKNVEKHLVDHSDLMPMGENFAKMFDLPEVHGSWSDWWLLQRELENELDKTDTRHIINLCKHRMCLWT